MAASTLLVPNKAPAAPNAAPAAGAVRDFIAATRRIRVPFEDYTTPARLSASASFQRGPVDVHSRGYLRGVWLIVTCPQAGSGGSAVAHEDGPWDVLQNVVLSDVNGAPIVGPLSGYDLYLCNVFGGYHGVTSDPADWSSFSAVNATTGVFQFVLYLPVEVRGRDALGALANFNSAATYKLSYTVGPSTEVYSTPPATTIPDVRVRAIADIWDQVAPVDRLGVPQATTPPMDGTVQMWTRSIFNITSGENRVRLTRVGNHIRNLIAIFRNTTPARNTSNFPADLRVEHNGRFIELVPRDLLVDQARIATGETPPTGVFVWNYCADLDGTAGWEIGNDYIRTSGGDTFELLGSFGAAGTLTVLTNDLIPAGALNVAAGGAA